MSQTGHIGAIWRQWRDRLAAAGISEAVSDAKLLTGAVLGLDSLGMITREVEIVEATAQNQIGQLMARRLAGEPVARILGQQEFYGLDFELNANTLIPRPETELLVEWALAALGSEGETLLDLGTGSGCLGIAILANAPRVCGVGVDLSAQALQLAATNAAQNGVSERFALIAGSWYEPLEAAQRFDVIVANPPYIATKTIAGLVLEVRDFDPVLALDGGVDGLDPYRIIVTQSPHWLASGGQLGVEIGYDQGAKIEEIFSRAGLINVRTIKDLAGLDRIVCGRKNS